MSKIYYLFEGAKLEKIYGYEKEYYVGFTEKVHNVPYNKPQGEAV